MQRLGLEWAYRLYREPGRYVDNTRFLLCMLTRDLLTRGRVENDV